MDKIFIGNYGRMELWRKKNVTRSFNSLISVLSIYLPMFNSFVWHDSYYIFFT